MGRCAEGIRGIGVRDEGRGTEASRGCLASRQSEHREFLVRDGSCGKGLYQGAQHKGCAWHPVHLSGQDDVHRASERSTARLCEVAHRGESVVRWRVHYSPTWDSISRKSGRRSNPTVRSSWRTEFLSHTRVILGKGCTMDCII